MSLSRREHVTKCGTLQVIILRRDSGLAKDWRRWMSVRDEARLAAGFAFRRLLHVVFALMP